MSNNAVFLTGKMGEWKVEERAIPSVQENTILIRSRAAALNPIDFKIREIGHLVNKWPAILGWDVAGVVEAIGANVQGFAVGDRVAGFAQGTAMNDPDHGGFQQHVLLKAVAAWHVPEKITFQQASTLPMAVITAIACLRDVGVNLPGAPVGKREGTKAVLIWGGSSSVGTAAIQLAHASGAVVFTTASPTHHSYVRRLGADFVFDYRSPKVLKEIVATAKGAGVALHDAVDAVSLDPVTTSKVLEALGGGHLALTLASNAEYPASVNVFDTGARNSLADPAFFSWLTGTYLTKAMESGELVPAEVEIIPGGVGGIEAGLARLEAGVSGIKLIVEP